MSPAAAAVMGIVCTFVWGGFVVLLTRAVRKEGAKARERVGEPPPHPSP